MHYRDRHDLGNQLDRYLVLALTIAAIAGFTRIILVPAAAEEIHINRALRAYRSGWPAEVVESELVLATRDLPSDPRPHTVWAEILAERGFIDRAIAQQRQAIDKNPCDWASKSDLARLLEEKAKRRIKAI